MPTGAWRWAALGFVLLALIAAGLTLAAPEVAGLAGYALLGGIGVVAALFVFAVWPRGGRAARDALRVAEAAGKRQCRLGDHRRRRRGAGLQSRLSPHGGRRAKTKPRRRPNWRWRASPAPRCSIACRATPPKAAPGRKRFQVLPGLEIVAAVRPLPDKQAAWWFTPRLAASTSPQPVLSRAAKAARPARRLRAGRACACRHARACHGRIGGAAEYRRSVPRRAHGRGLCRRARRDQRRQCRAGEILRRVGAAGRKEFRRAGGGRRPRPGAWR